MDSSEFSDGHDKNQIDINRRRASAIRDFEDDHDHARADLAFKMGGVLGNAINDAAGDDPNASANAFFTATQSIEHIVLEQDWAVKRALRAFLRVLS